jgi:hypothetical protein
MSGRSTAIGVSARLLNRERLQAGLPRLNHKRIYRLMAQNGLLLQRYTGKPPGRLHEGRIITIRPNLRWSSDSFEVACWNGEVLRVAFALAPASGNSWLGAPAAAASAGRWCGI